MSHAGYSGLPQAESVGCLLATLFSRWAFHRASTDMVVNSMNSVVSSGSNHIERESLSALLLFGGQDVEIETELQAGGIFRVVALAS